MIDQQVKTVVVLASGNKGKLKELQYLLGDAVRVISADEIGVKLPEETGTTFTENAILKAAAAFSQSGYISLADDSGLEVDALDGQPGVHSARYSGPDATDAENNAKLLNALGAVPDGKRTARFRSAIAVQTNDGPPLVFEGVCEGNIGFAPVGDGGFGYDPLFHLKSGQSMAEMNSSQKNSVSHRGEAMGKAVPALMQLLNVKTGAS